MSDFILLDSLIKIIERSDKKKIEDRDTKMRPRNFVCIYHLTHDRKSIHFFRASLYLAYDSTHINRI